MGWLPLVTLLVVSLGIVNTIAASVRARQWEFGILRAVGVRRFTLARVVLAEAILIGVAASVLSLGFGILTGWNCLGLVRYVSNPWFEGVSTALVIPWTIIGFGYGLTFLLCVVAALWPAIQASRTEPLQLLQRGRSAM
jgi:putative ABC transport system permease protein